MKDCELNYLAFSAFRFLDILVLNLKYRCTYTVVSMLVFFLSKLVLLFQEKKSEFSWYKNDTTRVQKYKKFKIINIYSSLNPQSISKIFIQSQRSVYAGVGAGFFEEPPAAS